MRTLHTLDYSEARKVVDLIVSEAAQRQKAAAIAIADGHGDLIAFARMDGSPVSSIRIAINKAWAAARERKPTKDIGEIVKHPPKIQVNTYYGDRHNVGWSGGILASKPVEC